MKYFYYDNRTDPTSLRDGQYGWKTKFSHLGASYLIRTSTRLYSQWISGSTTMGIGTDLLVDNDFKSWYLGISESLGAFEVTLRYDDFDVIDRDSMPLDNNDQDGNAWVFAVRYDINSSIAILSEYTDVKESKPAREYQSLALKTHHRLAQLAIQWRF